jgi:cystathionine beta-lyase/cystathionine gamma-synthase
MFFGPKRKAHKRSHADFWTSTQLHREVRDRLGISDSLHRLSGGIENQDDLVDDILQALEHDE